MRNRKLVSGMCIFLAALMCLSVVMSAVAGTGALGVSQSEIDALERQKEQIAAEKEEMSSAMEELEQQQATALERKAVLDGQNTLTIEEIELINEQIEIYDGLIAEKEVELEEAIEQEEYQKERFRMRMRAMEENSTLGYIEFIFQASSFPTC